MDPKHEGALDQLHDPDLEVVPFPEVGLEAVSPLATWIRNQTWKGSSQQLGKVIDPIVIPMTITVLPVRTRTVDQPTGGYRRRKSHCPAARRDRRVFGIILAATMIDIPTTF